MYIYSKNGRFGKSVLDICCSGVGMYNILYLSIYLYIYIYIYIYIYSIKLQ